MRACVRACARVCVLRLFRALSRRVGTLQLSVINIFINIITTGHAVLLFRGSVPLCCFPRILSQFVRHWVFRDFCPSLSDTGFFATSVPVCQTLGCSRLLSQFVRYWVVLYFCPSLSDTGLIVLDFCPSLSDTGLIVRELCLSL